MIHYGHFNPAALLKSAAIASLVLLMITPLANSFSPFMLLLAIHHGPMLCLSRGHDSVPRGTGFDFAPHWPGNSTINLFHSGKYQPDTVLPLGRSPRKRCIDPGKRLCRSLPSIIVVAIRRAVGRFSEMVSTIPAGRSIPAASGDLVGDFALVDCSGIGSDVGGGFFCGFATLLVLWSHEAFREAGKGSIAADRRQVHKVRIRSSRNAGEMSECGTHVELGSSLIRWFYRRLPSLLKPPNVPCPGKAAF